MKNKITMLAVDDDPISTKILVEHLQSLDYQVDPAYSGKEAWELLNQNPAKYSVVIADRMMEGMDGIGLIQKMKASANLHTIPVIIQTGEAEPEEFIAAIKAGAFDFIYKPVELKLLMHVVKNALEKELIDRQKSFENL